METGELVPPPPKLEEDEMPKSISRQAVGPASGW